MPDAKSVFRKKTIPGFYCKHITPATIFKICCGINRLFIEQCGIHPTHTIDLKMQLDQIIKDAVCLKNFNTLGTRISMSPLGRIPTRPAEQQGDPRYGSVLAVLFESEQKLHVLLIKRREDLRHHPGQISFPGGRLEPNEEPLVCALRETREEIGIQPEALIIAGGLQPAYILASDFLVYPFAAWHNGIPSCTPDPREVDAVFHVPLDLLCKDNARTYEIKDILGTMRKVPGFSFQKHHVWGATAMLLHEIIERLKMAGWQDEHMRTNMGVAGIS